MSAQLHPIGKSNPITNRTVMCDMAVGHEIASPTDTRDAVSLCAAGAHGNVLTDNAVLTNHEARGAVAGTTDLGIPPPNTAWA